jgi:hypothetical protein
LQQLIFNITEQLQGHFPKPIRYLVISGVGLTDEFPIFTSEMSPKRKVERHVKVLIKNLDIFSVSQQGKQFLLVSYQIQLLEYFPQKQKEQRQEQLRYTDKVVTMQKTAQNLK